MPDLGVKKDTLEAKHLEAVGLSSGWARCRKCG
jgi:hypothetical protein